MKFNQQEIDILLGGIKSGSSYEEIAKKIED